ncbi:phosphoribosylaminoimidazolesuccinocarboxamide synthase [bacterium]|nr:MAG: phosphoribosylaminoimidazolesuccinocarboxamide synthase [bacterium]
MPALLRTDIPGLPSPKVGKVREVYDLGDELLIVATDRISAFDVVMENGVPDKGRILNLMSAWWFERLQNVCPNHIIAVSDDEIQRRLPQEHPELSGRTTVARKCQPLTIECVARGYISGSLFKEYRAQGGTVHGLGLPDGLVDSDRLPEPIFTPATKAEEGHDENIDWNRAVDMVGLETAQTVRDWTLELYRRASEHAASVGLILADTKFEFGLTDDGIVWIDEALTPDSSRYWPMDQYKPGGAQPSYDKQFVRDYLETISWDKTPPGPRLPDEVVEKTRAKYVEAFELVTGQSFR